MALLRKGLVEEVWEEAWEKCEMKGKHADPCLLCVCVCVCVCVHIVHVCASNTSRYILRM